MVTKLDSSEPTWAGEVGAKVVQVSSALSHPNKHMGPTLSTAFWFHVRRLAKCARCGAKCALGSGMRKHNKQQQQECPQEMERRNNGGIPTPQSFLQRTINVSAVSSPLAASLQCKPPLSDLLPTCVAMPVPVCVTDFLLLLLLLLELLPVCVK